MSKTKVAIICNSKMKFKRLGTLKVSVLFLSAQTAKTLNNEKNSSVDFSETVSCSFITADRKYRWKRCVFVCILNI